MSINDYIDISLLDGLIIGRVEPNIYAFSTETVPNYLKVGDTYRPVETRLNEWRKYFPQLKKELTELAKVDQETYFRDYEIHYFLENEKHKQRLKRDIFPDLAYFSNEFFQNTIAQDIKDAIEDIKNSHKKNEGKYQFYKFDSGRIPNDFIYERTEDYKPRPNQQITINKFNEALKKGRSNLLMYAVMRFGKSFTAMCCATEINAKIVVIVSAKADVKGEWKRTVQSHKRFEDYEFLDSDALLHSDKAISEKLNNGKKVVVFLTLQDLQGDDIKTKHNEIFNKKFDLLIIDETHFGARASEYGKVLLEEKLTKKELQNELKRRDNTFDELEANIKVLDSKVRLHLSGTPYRILMGSEFSNDDIIAFYQFSDIVEDQEKWNDENINKDSVQEWSNPYYGFPQMIRFAFNPNKSSRSKMEELKKSGISYTFSALFKPKSLIKDNFNQNHKKFENEKEILDLLEVIDGSKNDNNLLGFLNYSKIKDGKMCRHIVCVLPFRASCDALEKLIENNKKNFINLNSYEIINIAGVENERKYKETQTVKAKIKECEQRGKKTITLTVNRMMTGSTVEEWDTMLYFKDTASPQEYDQSIFRLQNQYIKTLIEPNGDIIKFNMKPQTLLVDFDPNRMFRMQEQKSQIYNVNTEANGNTKLETRIKRELDISPIVVLNKNKLIQVLPSDVLKAVSEYSNNKSVYDEATVIPVDFSLFNIDQLRAEIEKQAKIGSRQGFEIIPIEDEGDDIEIPIPKDEKEDIPPDQYILPDKTDTNKVITESDFKDKFAMYYAKILFFSFLINTEVKSLSEVINQIDLNDTNKRIANSLDLNKGVLTLLQNKINPFILSKLDYKIQNINTLANDKTLQPIDRASNALKKFSRLSDSEVVTPERVTEMMINILPKDALSNSNKILDIASKQGEFVYAIYKKHGKEIAENLYSITTSKIAYEFTRKIYELLNLDVSRIIDEYTSYDIIKNDINIFNNDKIKIKDSYMKFDVIIGNPPYQSADGSGGASDSAIPIYNKFIDNSIALNPKYLVMITPSKWMLGGRGLKKFRNNMINDKRIRKIYDYENASDCFSGQLHIDGGVSYFLWDRDFNGKAEYNFKANDGSFTKRKRFLKNDYFEYVVRDNRALSLIEKVTNGKRLSEIVSLTRPYGIRNYLFNKPDRYPNSNLSFKSFKNSYKIYGVKGIKGGAKRIIGYVSKQTPTKNLDSIKKYKIYFTTSFSTNAINPPEIIMGEPNSICTETFLIIGPFENKKQQNNCKTYIDTNFFKVLLYLGKGTMHVTRSVFGLIPLQNFNEEWSDKKLYKKYKLNKSDIKFIESKICQ